MSATKPEDEQCPVCGYYCLGNGGIGCIDKPTYIKNYYKAREEPADEPSIPISKIKELISKSDTFNNYAYSRADLQQLINKAND